ncbi:MAG: Trypsin [Pseudomonadota bacterium]|jgi:hypothetical protein
MDQKRSIAIPLSVTSLLFAFIAACGERGGDSGLTRTEARLAGPSGKGTCLKVANGVETPQMSGVVVVRTAGGGLCTGTFLGDNAVVTAAHCIDASPSGNVKIWGEIPPKAVFHAGIAGEAAFDQTPSLDIAVLLLPDNSSRAWRKIASVPPRVGDQLTVAGFGRTSALNGGPPDGKLRYGFNKVGAVSVEEAIMVYDAPTEYKGVAVGEESMGAPGDSGGPIIVGNGLVGLTSGGGLDERANRVVGVNFLLFSAPALKAMEAAEARGAHINGINNVRKALGVKVQDDTSSDKESMVSEADDSSC